jgi:hypothetical protein
MREDADRHVDIEQILAEACQRGPLPEPSERWHEKVMEAIRTERAGPQILRFRAEARMAWRGALAAAAAAVIVAAVGLWARPSDARLAWELQQDSTLSAWALQTGESR